MIRRALSLGLFFAILAGSAMAADIDRHGTYNEAGASATKCKDFIGTDDNRTACVDWCSKWMEANADTKCSCDEGACPHQDAAEAAPAASPSTAQ